MVLARLPGRTKGNKAPTRGDGARDGRWLLYSTRAGNVREKAKDSAGLRRKDKRTRQTEYEKRTRMLIGLKLNPTHLSLLAAFRSAVFPPIRSFLLWVFVLLPGSLALRAKIGTSLWPSPLPFLPSEEGRFAGQRGLVQPRIAFVERWTEFLASWKRPW